MTAKYLTPLLIGLAGQAIISLIALTPPVIAVVMAPDLGLRTSDIGLFSSILFLSGMISASIGGGLVRRFGAIRVSQLCLLSCAGGIALLATATIPLMALGASLVGLGYGPMTPAGSHLLVNVTNPNNRPLVFSIKQTSIPLGGGLAGILAPALLEFSDWQTAVLMIAGFGVGFAIFLQYFRNFYDQDRDCGSAIELHIFRVIKRGLQQKGLRRLCLATTGYSATQASFNAFFVIFLVERAALSLFDAGVIFTLAQFSGVAGRILWGSLAGRWISSHRLLIILGGVMALASLSTIWVDSSWSLSALTALGICFGMAASGWNGLYLAQIVGVTSEAETATATGVSLFFTFGGMMIAPAIFSGIVFVTGSFSIAFVLLALAMIPSMFLMLPKSS